MTKPPGKAARRYGDRPSQGRTQDRKSGGKPPWRQDRRSGRQQQPADSEDDRIRLFGLHAVSAALQNPRRTIRTLYVTQNAERRLRALAPFTHPEPTVVLPKDLDRRLGADTVHQGVFAECEDLPEPSIDDLSEQSIASGRPLIVLDQVTDPHNVGAVLRSAAAFGASGLVMTRRHSPRLSGALAKAASGALEVVPVALVQNLARSIAKLKEDGFHVVGLEGTASVALEDAIAAAPLALVCGAEGKGLRQATKDGCTKLCAITTDGPIDSLNISNAAAVALYVHSMHRRGLLSAQ